MSNSPPKASAADIGTAIPAATQPIWRTEKSTAPLVWIDCEMTGLNPLTDRILQICCYITDHNLNLLEPNGFEIVIHQEKQVLDLMDEWCQTTHLQTGLTSRVLASPHSPQSASAQLFTYLKTHIPEPKRAQLAGNTIHMDRQFLFHLCPEVLDHLHYRIVDASSIKECVKRWCSQELIDSMPKKTYTHEARQDILESIEEMKWYRTMFFEGK